MAKNIKRLSMTIAMCFLLCTAYPVLAYGNTYTIVNESGYEIQMVEEWWEPVWGPDPGDMYVKIKVDQYLLHPGAQVTLYMKESSTYIFLKREENEMCRIGHIFVGSSSHEPDLIVQIIIHDNDIITPRASGHEEYDTWGELADKNTCNNLWQRLCMLNNSIFASPRWQSVHQQLYYLSGVTK